MNGHVTEHLNGGTNGITNGTSDVVSNGISNGTSNGVSSSVQQRRLFVLSTSDKGGLDRLAELYHSHLANKSFNSLREEDIYMSKLAYTLSEKRSMFPWRSFVIASSIPSLLDDLKSSISKPIRPSGSHDIGYIFTGQGAQWYAMGRKLTAYPVYLSSLEESERQLRSINSKWSLIGRLSSVSLLQHPDRL